MTFEMNGRLEGLRCSSRIPLIYKPQSGRVADVRFGAPSRGSQTSEIKRKAGAGHPGSDRSANGSYQRQLLNCGSAMRSEARGFWALCV